MEESTKETAASNPSLRQRGSMAYRRARLRLRPLVQWVRWSQLERQVKKPVFIFGSTRSGKTILKTLLGEHPGIAAYPGEANHLWHPATHPWQYSPHRLSVPPYWAGPALHTEASLKLRGQWQSDHIRTVFGAFAWARRPQILLAESAKITFMIPYILDLFPDARFIHLVRHGRCVSYLQGKKIAAAVRSNYRVYAEVGYGLADDEIYARCARSWTEHVLEAQRLIAGGSLVPRARILEVRYENLCEDARSEFERICAFVGLDSHHSGSSTSILLSITNHNAQVEAQIGDNVRNVLSDNLEPTLSSLEYS
jgi:hypothetical protein